jgi:hypothetical protein
MEEALKTRGKEPVSEFYRWNDYLRKAATFDSGIAKRYKPTSDRPLVYHLHGSIDVPQSMVLIVRDYIDFIKSTNE